MISLNESYSRSSTTDDDSDHEENTPIIKRNSTTRKKSYKKWTKEEDERLKEFIHCNGGIKDWSRISHYVGNGRTDAQCQHRWERFLDPSITKGPWTDEEDRKVIELVRDYGARQWSLIAKELKGRVGKQCRERWHNHLNPAINKNPWTNEENLLLFILHQHFGNKWAEIARHFNGRSDNSIKNHWNSSMKKKFELEVSNLKRQGLEWTALIPSDFPWPKLDKPSTTRTPLNTITNRVHRPTTKKLPIEKIHSPAPMVVKNETHMPMMNSNMDHQQHFYSNTDSHHLHIPTTHVLPPVYPEVVQPQPSPHPQSENSSQNLETIFYCTPPSPAKPLPMLSSCADYTPSSQHSQTDVHMSLFPSAIDYYTTSQPSSQTSSITTFTCSPTPHLTILSPETANTHHRPLYSNDDPFALHFHSHSQTNTNMLIKTDHDHLLLDLNHAEQQHHHHHHHDAVISPQTISNTSSPSKHRVLNTPERLVQPHQIRFIEHDWFTDYLPFPDPMPSIPVENIHENKENSATAVRLPINRRNKRLNRYPSNPLEPKKRESFARNLFQSSKKLREELGYEPSYDEILIGQTRDQRLITEQARRYLASSALNHSH